MLYELLQKNIANIIRGDFQCNIRSETLLSRTDEGKVNEGDGWKSKTLTFHLADGIANYGTFNEDFNFETFFINPLDSYDAFTFSCLLETGQEHKIELLFRYENKFETLGIEAFLFSNGE